MKIGSPLLALILALPLPSAATLPDATQALQPGEVLVEFRVRGTGHNPSGYLELYSRPTWDEPDCVFVRIPDAAKTLFASAGIPDVARHFAGHRIRARGRMEILALGKVPHACVIVRDPARITRLDGATDFTPTSAYTLREIRGFDIRIAPELDRHPEELREALAELDRQLAAICATIDDARLQVLRQSRFWLELEANPRGAAEHHPARAWLVASGYNPDKTGDVEINNARNFVAWSRAAQPWMVMHELAHAYHHRTRATHGERIEAAYRKAMDARLYDDVSHVSGRRQRAYAAKNPMEYFAELSEAHLGKNDFEPFDRQALERFDPDGAALMRDVWGVAPRRD